MIVSKYLIHILKEDRKNILKNWEKRATQEVSFLFGSPLVLQPDLDKFMVTMEEALEEDNQCGTIDKVQVYLDQLKNKPKPRHYSSDQALFEYHLFKEVLFESLENSMPLKTSESDLLLNIIEHAVASSTPVKEHMAS